MVNNRSIRRGHRSVVRQQLVHAQPGLMRDAFQQFRRGQVHSVHQVVDRRLANAQPLCKGRLGGSGPFEIFAKSLHMFDNNIGLPYNFAIGSPYIEIEHNHGMAKPKERSFLERAFEAYQDRYRQKATQEKIGKIVGVSQPAAREWGFPDRAPDHAGVLKLAKELNVCVEWLYTERGPKHPIADPESDPFLKEYGQLDEERRSQLLRYSEFLRNEPAKNQ